MKKLFFTVALAVVALAANAQEVGKMWVGGSVGIWSSKVDTEGSKAATSYKILPEFGYIFSENMAVGINVGYAHLEGQGVSLGTHSSEIDGTKADAFIVNPFLRYSFLKGTMGSMFVDGGVGFTSAKEKGADKSATTLEVGFRPGLAINVSEKVAVTGKFGFIGYQNEKAPSDQKTNSFGIDLDMRNVLLGVSLVF